MPLGMSDYGDWNICPGPGLMAYASDLDILPHCHVWCMFSKFHVLATSLNY